MTTQPSETQHGGRSSSDVAFSELTKQIAERNERVHMEARELRAAHERKQLGIVARQRLDVDR